MRLPIDPPSWVSQYIGLEFAAGGRDRDAIDCWGLVRLVYLEQLGIILPAFGGRYDAALRPDDVLPVLSEQHDSGNWEVVEPETGRVGDVVEFHHPTHVGVLVADGKFLHARAGALSSIESIESKVWDRRLVCLRRYSGPVAVVRSAGVFDQSSTSMEIAHGGTIADIMHAAGVAIVPGLCVYIGDRQVPTEAWSLVRPRPGRVLRVMVVPQGGGGGGSKVLRLVLTIAVIVGSIATAGAIAGAGVAALGFAAGSTGATVIGSLAGAAISIGGSLLINSLIPAAKPTLSDRGEDTLQSQSITGARNELRTYNPIARLLGTFRLVPNYAAKPYTELSGDDQYFRMLLLNGYGPLQLGDFKIGDTPLLNYTDVQTEIHYGYGGSKTLTLFPGVVREDALNVLLNAADAATIRTTAANIEEISLDLTWPNGLVQYDGGGSPGTISVRVDIQYRLVGTSTWFYVNGDASTTGSPETTQQMDILTRVPLVSRGGTQTHTGRVAWSGGGQLPDAKPSYLPASRFMWVAEGYLQITVAGTYLFALDSSDAADVEVDGQIVSTRYGVHGPLGTGGTPNFSGSTNIAIALDVGFHPIVIRCEKRSGAGGAIALGWKGIGDPSFVITPGSVLWKSAGGAGDQAKLNVTWYDTSGYTSFITATSNTTGTIRRSIAWAVPSGQYEVWVKRNTADRTGTSVFDKVYLTALRSFDYADPVNQVGISRVALRIKATDQLNGIIDQFNCMATSVLPDYDQPSGTWIRRATNNPAALFRAVLQSRGIGKPVVDSRLDLTSIQAWHDFCRTSGFTFGALIDYSTTVVEVLAQICAAGRAQLTYTNGKLGVVIDREQTVPSQHFTPRNSRGFKMNVTFSEAVHAVNVRFIDATEGYGQNTLQVVDDGYGITEEGVRRDARGNVTTDPEATIFEALELPGVTDPTHAWRAARYVLAVKRLRTRSYELETDVEHLASVRGDLVMVSNDAALIGSTYGRVRSQVLNGGGDVIGLELDDQVTMVSGSTNVIRVRLASGVSLVKSVVYDAGPTNYLTFQSPILAAVAAASKPTAGDLYQFGVQNLESRAMLVKAINMDRDLSAKLTLIDQAPAVYGADTPPYTPNTPPLFLGVDNNPDSPAIANVRSDAGVMTSAADGTFAPRIALRLQASSGTREQPVVWQVRIREALLSGADAPSSWRTIDVAASSSEIAIDGLTPGRGYELQARGIGASGRASGWTSMASHTVESVTTPPPPLTSLECFELGDGTRRINWAFGIGQHDAVLIRYGRSVDDWDASTPLVEVPAPATQAETGALPSGSWTIRAKARDPYGNLSSDLAIAVVVGSAPLLPIAIADDAAFAGWPGAITGGSVDSSGVVVADVVMSGTGVLAPLTYETSALDAGQVIAFAPDVAVTALGSVSIEVSWSSDGTTYSTPTNLAQARERIVSARYLKAIVTVSVATGVTTPTLQAISLRMRARLVTHRLQGLDIATLAGSLRLGTGDCRIPIPAGTMTKLLRASVALVNTAAAYRWELVDRSTSPGPRVRVYNASGAAADAVLDVELLGLP